MSETLSGSHLGSGPLASGRGTLKVAEGVTTQTANEQGTGRTVEIIRPEISEGLIEALLHSRMVRAPQFTGDLRCNVGKVSKLA